MRVVNFIVGSFGGAERFFVKLATALSEYPVDQHIIHNAHPMLREAIAATGLPRTEVDVRKGLDIAGRLRLRSLIRSLQPDIVLHWMNRAGRRAVRGRHVNIGRLGGFYPVKNYRRCDYLIANTPQIRDHILRQGWPETRVRMISNFGELAPLAPASRAELEVPEDSFMLLALGRSDPWKGFDTLISALKELPDRTFLCLAGGGARMQELKAHALAEGVGGRVRFLGWRDDQAALLGAADLCVVPSYHEPLSNVTLEAWSLGVPVVAAASEGPSWLITPGETGLLCTPKDPHDLAAKIRQAMEDGDLRRTIAEGGHRKWQEQFSKKAICEQYLSFFREVMPRNGKRF